MKKNDVITVAIYNFRDGRLIFKVPFKVLSETKGCYFAEGNGRYLKSKMDTPIFHCGSGHPYLSITMLNGSRDTLVMKILGWFRKNETDIAMKFAETSICSPQGT